jgi:hypothetical protein
VGPAAAAAAAAAVDFLRTMASKKAAPFSAAFFIIGPDLNF